MVPFDARAGFQPLAQRFDIGPVKTLGSVDMLAPAVDRRTGAEVALYRRVSVNLEGFLEDVELARRVDSPYVPRILDTVTVSEFRGSYGPLLDVRTGMGDGFFVLAPCTGPTLEDLCRDRALDLAEAGPMLVQLAHAVHATTSVSPEARELTLYNATWTARGLACLDFGTRSYAHDLRTQIDHRFRTRMPYLAPEQVHGQPITERTAVYTYGTCCYRMLVGELPYARAQQLPDRIPEPARDLIAWTLQRDPSQRPSVVELIELAERSFV